MKNPNSTTTTIKQSSKNVVIEFGYNSAKLAKYDFAGIKNTYANASSVVLEGAKVTVVIPVSLQ